MKSPRATQRQPRFLGRHTPRLISYPAAALASAVAALERAARALGEDVEFHPLDQIGQGVAHLRLNFGIDQRQMCLCVRRL